MFVRTDLWVSPSLLLLMITPVYRVCGVNPQPGLLILIHPNPICDYQAQSPNCLYLCRCIVRYLGIRLQL